MFAPGAIVLADAGDENSVSFGIKALSRALTLNVYKVLGLKPEAIYVVLACQSLFLEASFVHSKKYCTGIESSVAVVAVIVIED